MNYRGQVVFLGLMLCLTIVILALALAAPIKQATDGARQSSTEDTIGMNCSDSSISNYDKIACISTDLSLPLFVGIMIFIGGALLGAKYFLGQ